jgi:metal-responsive CopG/Arc/MetJ family transcriptional regulator
MLELVLGVHRPWGFWSGHISRLSRTNRSLSVFEATANASLSTSLTERDCLEIVVVQGETGRIRELLEALRARKGDRQAKLTVVSP